MKLEIASNTLYAGGVFLCHTGVGNGRDDLPVGRYPVAPTYSHSHGRNLALAEGLGWLGASDKCDVVLGNVRIRDRVLPHLPFETRLFTLVEAADERGEATELVIT